MATEKANGRNNKKRLSKKARTYSTIVLILMMLVAIAFLVMVVLVDAFPKELIGIMIGVLAGMVIIGGLLLFGRSKWLRALGTIIALCCIAVYGLGVYYLSSTYAMFSRISTAETEAEADQADVTANAFNIYITGIDQWTKNKGMDLERSDVNMILTVNPNTRKILLTSIPRDSYVPLHRTGTMDKLTHTGIYGVDETLNTVEDWMGIDLSYYFKANFDACVKLVDAIGGIDIDNPTEFKSALNGHLYEKGKIHLQGRGALYYARERKAFEGEDQLRVRNQLRVVKAILDKVLTSTTLLTSYGDIMEVLGDEVETNMPTSDMKALVKMQLAYPKSWEIETQRMTGEYEMAIVASMDPSNEYLVLKVDNKAFTSCVDNINAVMNPTQEEIDAVREAIETDKKETLFKSFINKLTGRGSDEEEGTEENNEG